MEETVTVQQLSQALNQLLDAYENLQKKNSDLKEELEDAQLQLDTAQTENEELKEQVSLLSSTTTEQTSEMDAMINRIESILSNAPIMEEPEEEGTDTNETEAVPSLYDNEEETTTQNEPEATEAEEKKEDTSKDQPDLGRMQALLNGFNN